MALQMTPDVREARANAIETAVGATAVLKIWGGSPPALAGDADVAGSALATMTLPSDWMAAASTASNVTTKAKSGTWEVAAANSGTATHFRIYASDGTTRKLQGTCGIGTGDLQLNNTSIAAGQTVTITAFTITEPNG